VPAQLLALAADHVRAEVAVGALGVALGAQPLGQVQTMATGSTSYSRASRNQVAAGLGLHVGGRVDHGQAARLEALADEEPQHLERGRVADWSFSSSATSPRQSRRR